MNNLLGECDYRTPCKWCVKWDKPCDKKQGCTASAQAQTKTLADIYPTIESGRKALEERKNNA